MDLSFIRKFASTAQILSKAKKYGLGVVDGKVYVNVDGSVGLWADEIADSALNVGAKNGSTVSVVETGFGGFLHKSVFTLAATPCAVADATAGGGVKIYDFPEGGITILGGSFSLAPTTTSTIASTLKAGVTIEIGIGSAAAGAGSLTTTEEDMVDGVTGPSSTVINVAAAVIKGVRTSAPGCINGSATAVDASVNVGVPTATDIDADAAITLTGTVTLIWMFNGDV
jgi:hypothetical protein